LLEEELDVGQVLLGRPKLTRLLHCHVLHLLGKKTNDQRLTGPSAGFDGHSDSGLGDAEHMCQYQYQSEQRTSTSCGAGCTC
jgi:hypothetical protein